MSQSLKSIIDYGASLGYKEETLRDFVKLQQEIEREERKAERERVKEELDFKRLMEKHDKELQIQQITHQQQTEMMHEKEKLKAAGVDETIQVRIDIKTQTNFLFQNQTDVVTNATEWVILLRSADQNQRNADSEKMSQDDEAIVSSAVIDCPEDEDVEEYGLPSVGDKEELSSVDINQELSPQDRQKRTLPIPGHAVWIGNSSSDVFQIDAHGFWGPEYRTLSSVVYRNGVTCEVQCTSVLTTSISP
uniref:Uncharacterized protein n=1 Tax=Magallana gigas TaxID=29159 RepID=A0A8W8IGQ0_MAGGI